MADDIKIEGFDELLSKLEDMGRKGSSIENKALKQGGEIIKDKAEKLAPESSINHKHLKDNIEVSKVKSKDGIKYVEVGASKDIWWDVYEEFGTSQKPAHPWLQPAFEEKNNEVIETMKEMIKRELGL